MKPLDKSELARLKARYRRDRRRLDEAPLRRDAAISALPLWQQRALAAEIRRREGKEERG